MTLYCGVSFARAPLEEISGMVERIRALGWAEREDGGRGDPWAVSFVKDVPEEDADTEVACVRDVMGEYWLGPEEIRELLRSSRASEAPSA
jgi:hypothetical protein